MNEWFPFIIVWFPFDICLNDYRLRLNQRHRTWNIIDIFLNDIDFTSTSVMSVNFLILSISDHLKICSSRFSAGLLRSFLGACFLAAYLILDPIYPTYHILGDHFLVRFLLSFASSLSSSLSSSSTIIFLSYQPFLFTCSFLLRSISFFRFFFFNISFFFL